MLALWPPSWQHDPPAQTVSTDAQRRSAVEDQHLGRPGLYGVGADTSNAPAILKDGLLIAPLHLPERHTIGGPQDAR